MIYVAIYGWERYSNGGARVAALSAADMPSAIAEAEAAAGGDEDLVGVLRVIEAHIPGTWPDDVALAKRLAEALATG